MSPQGKKGKEVTIQIFSGGYGEKATDFEEVRAKLESAVEMLPVFRVIMGWTRERELYRKTAGYLRERGIEFFLWLPVFSEAAAGEPIPPVVDYSGKEVSGYGMGSEDFTFYCANDRRNMEKAARTFEEHFEGIGFDGVFLDKIRYPSFVNGLGGVLSCFCPCCTAKYERRGFDTEKLRAEIPRLPEYPAPFGVTGYRDGKYTFAEKIWEDFFAFKAESVAARVGELCAWFRDRGYKTGLDVFAPFMSQFVGQDIGELSKHCDFVKPMMYRATYAPAGLPFELDALLKEAHADTPEKRRAFCGLLGTDWRVKPTDIAFAARELKALARHAACPVCAGVEVNRVPGIAESDPSYVRETLEGCGGTGAAGFVLSWNLMQAPMENIRAAAECL